MHAIVIAILVLIVLCFLYLFLIMPNLTGKKYASFLLNKNIAHRGLHNKDQGIPENSLLSAKLAAQSGYPIELDIHLSKDGEVMVFHDYTLDRVSNGTGNICDFTVEELQKLSLQSTNQTIPTFKQFLDEVKGKVALVIEIKSDKRNDLLCEKTVDHLKYYSGNFVIKSFNPSIVFWFKKNHPEIIRGQLSTFPNRDDAHPIVAFFSSHMVANFWTKPHFISYDLRYSNNMTFRLLKRLGVLTLLWTVRNDEDFKKAQALNVDGIIFENIVPIASFQKEKMLKVASPKIPVSVTSKNDTINDKN